MGILGCQNVCLAITALILSVYDWSYLALNAGRIVFLIILYLVPAAFLLRAMKEMRLQGKTRCQWQLAIAAVYILEIVCLSKDISYGDLLGIRTGLVVSILLQGINILLVLILTVRFRTR